jgi:hopene-associated glycosyltransferase HpnB
MTWSPLALLACIGLLAWLWLLLGRGGFWRADQRLPGHAAGPEVWPAVAAVIPARDEAATIADAIRSLMAQDYPGRLAIIVVDDGSSDGTADIARAAGAGPRAVDVVQGRPLPPGWTGKMWAVSRGVARAAEGLPDARYFLLTDADIGHASDSVRRLVAKAEADRLDLVSLMVKLRCRTAWERLLIPAFVFFFQKLYPFRRVNDAARRTAGAAGGCMLVRRTGLDRIGGIAAVRGRVIDDCALAAAIKRGGRVWLGLAEESRSLRGYRGLSGIWDMIARTAFVQLGNSAVLLAGTVAAMVVVYLVPPLALVVGAATGDVIATGAGGLAWLAMAVAYRPTLALYGEPAWRAFLLPVAAALYTAMTVASAWRTWRGRGAVWKGRAYGAADGL